MKSTARVLSLAAIVLATSANAATFTEGFDSVAALSANGWLQANSGASPTNPWFQGNDGVFASQAGAANSYVGADYLSSGSGAIDNWLISPEITFSGIATLSFYTRHASAPPFDVDSLEVLFSAGSGTDVHGFTSLGVIDATAYPTDWTQVMLALPAASSGRFAFRYFGDAGSANYIGVDTVAVSIAAVPEPSTYALMALGLVGLGALRRRVA